MKSPAFDFSVLTLKDLATLQKVVDGQRGWSNDAVKLLRCGLVQEDGLYKVKPTNRGLLALQGVIKGQRVRVTPKHHLPDWHGVQGTVLGVHDTRTDSDGFDEFGYQIRWSEPRFRIDVKPDGDRNGTWCFYNIDDLEGIFLSGQ